RVVRRRRSVARRRRIGLRRHLAPIGAVLEIGVIAARIVAIVPVLKELFSFLKLLRLRGTGLLIVGLISTRVIVVIAHWRQIVWVRINRARIEVPSVSNRPPPAVTRSVPAISPAASGPSRSKWTRSSKSRAPRSRTVVTGSRAIECGSARRGSGDGPCRKHQRGNFEHSVSHHSCPCTAADSSRF